jgi:hypothetical protein
VGHLVLDALGHLVFQIHQRSNKIKKIIKTGKPKTV